MLATCFLFKAETEAQVIYTDIDPDIVLDENDEAAFLDLDANEVFDFAFLKGYALFSTLTYYGSPGANFTRTVQWVGGYGTSANMIAGSYEFFSGGSSGSSFSRYYPYAMLSGDVINEELSFQNWGYQRMAFKSYINYGIPWDNGGNWFPEKNDHYLGVRFVDDLNENHYGWIRCSVLDSADLLVIKDCAYELQTDAPIAAGDTVSYVDIEAISGLDVIVYSFSSDVFIQMKNISAVQVNILNLSGEKIYESDINQPNTIIPLDWVINGYYIVEVTSQKGRVVKKVYIN